MVIAVDSAARGIDDFSCKKLNYKVEYSMDVVSPENSTTAIVFIRGHTSIPVEFKENSLQ